MQEEESQIKFEYVNENFLDNFKDYISVDLEETTEINVNERTCCQFLSDLFSVTDNKLKIVKNSIAH